MAGKMAPPMAEKMAAPKDQRTVAPTVLQKVPMKVLGTVWRTVARMAHLTAHSRDLLRV